MHPPCPLIRTNAEGLRRSRFGSGNDADYTGYSLSAAYRFLPNLSGVLTFSDYKLEISGGGQIDYDSIIGLGVRLHY